MSDSNGVNAYNVNYHPRLCHLTKWDDFNGYGFNLHAEKGKSGQYIGKVDDGSPAQAAKLQLGDRIVEVNGVNIGNENHQQVVQRIKAGGDETKLLVVDAETDLYFKEHKIIVRGEMDEVVYCKTPLTSDAVASEGPVHVNSNHLDTETLNHNEETGEMTQEIKDVVDGGSDAGDSAVAAAVVMNGTKEEAAPEEPAVEVQENGISETVEVESVVKEEAVPEPEPEIAASEIIVEHEVPEPEPEPVVAAPEPEPVAPEPEPEPIAAEPEPVVAEPEPVVAEPEPVVAAPEPEPVVVIPEPQAEAIQPPTPEAPVETQTGTDLLDFGNVSVEEMKKRIQSKKKVDTRFTQMGLREKYDLLQRL